MKSQRGSVHVIITAVLALALIGALGFIFWQNLNKDEPIAASQSKKDQEVEQKTENVTTVPDGYELYKDGIVGFSLAYPKEWGGLKETATRPSSNRQGSNGKNTKTMVDSSEIIRLEIYTKDSFFATMASGHAVKYQDNRVIGTDDGSSVFEIRKPIAGTNVYAFDHGDAAGNLLNDLFFEVGDSVVFVHIGSSTDVQAQIAKSIKIE